ncbi:hypothetical protein ACTQ5X_02750 [Jeotgalibaca porci]|uniref:hypothetical protein n=1 Tax=Jeotgalibaca porci TaxID=1868793 RepID=UPI003F8E6FB5
MEPYYGEFITVVYNEGESIRTVESSQIVSIFLNNNHTFVVIEDGSGGMNIYIPIHQVYFLEA